VTNWASKTETESSISQQVPVFPDDANLSHMSVC